VIAAAVLVGRAAFTSTSTIWEASIVSADALVAAGAAARLLASASKVRVAGNAPSITPCRSIPTASADDVELRRRPRIGEGRIKLLMRQLPATRTLDALAERPAAHQQHQRISRYIEASPGWLK